MPEPGRHCVWPVWITAVVAMIWLLRAAAGLLIPVVLAICLSYALEPVVAWFARHMPRLAATCVVMVLVVSLIAWAGSSLRDEAMTAVSEGRAAAQRLQGLLGQYIGRDGGSAATPTRPCWWSRGSDR